MLRIEPLDQRDPKVARTIHVVLTLAHAQESALMQSSQFTPLGKTIADIQTSDEFILGALRGAELVGALSLGPDEEPGQIKVASLVVRPEYQRQGIGTSLMREALRRGEGMAFCVVTGASNAPALALYRTLGFVAYRHGAMGPEALPLVKLRRAAPLHVESGHGTCSP
jgi:ribosomal protein S18 acetylase RimI-like enzyme